MRSLRWMVRGFLVLLGILALLLILPRVFLRPLEQMLGKLDSSIQPPVLAPGERWVFRVNSEPVPSLGQRIAAPIGVFPPNTADLYGQLSELLKGPWERVQIGRCSVEVPKGENGGKTVMQPGYFERDYIDSRWKPFFAVGIHEYTQDALDALRIQNGSAKMEREILKSTGEYSLLRDRGLPGPFQYTYLPTNRAIPACVLYFYLTGINYGGPKGIEELNTMLDSLDHRAVESAKAK